MSTLTGPISGKVVAISGGARGIGEATAKAIRNFEVFYNYEVTGRITRGLVDLLTDNGATI